VEKFCVDEAGKVSVSETPQKPLLQQELNNSNTSYSNSYAGSYQTVLLPKEFLKRLCKATINEWIKVIWEDKPWHVKQFQRSDTKKGINRLKVIVNSNLRRGSVTDKSPKSPLMSGKYD
jgi:hypothetical protein